MTTTVTMYNHGGTIEQPLRFNGIRTALLYVTLALREMQQSPRERVTPIAIDVTTVVNNHTYQLVYVLSGTTLSIGSLISR